MLYLRKSGTGLVLFFLSITAGIALHTCSAGLTETDMQEVVTTPAGGFTNSGSPSTPDELLEEMSLGEKIGQLLVIEADGNFLHNESDELLDLKEKVKRHNVGGVMFFGGRIYNQAHLTNRLQAAADIPLLISQDMEFGPAMRVRDATYITPAMGVAATGNPDNAYLKGKITAREAKAMGVHQIYAPVVDVNNNPANPVINVRSFSEDPEMVIEFAEAFFRGVSSEGLIATAKHFPGHGDTDIDSHINLPRISHTYSRLDSLELKPFRHLIEQGIPSIMSAHISFPELSGEQNLPGTLDRQVLTGVLRDSLNFDGLVVTDALDMQGITSNFSPGEAATKALQAGADILLIPPDYLTTIDAIKRNVERGVLSEERIDESVRRVLAKKLELNLFEERFVEIENIPETVRDPLHQKTAEQIARESITLLRDRNETIPVRPYQQPRIQVIALADDRSGSTGNSFARAVRNHHPDVGFRIYDRRTHQDDVEQMLRDARRADLVILASFIRVRTSQSIQLSSGQRRFLNRLQQIPNNQALVSFGNPYVFEDYPEADIHISSWSSSSSHIQATADAIFGASPFNGTMPVSIPGLYGKGTGIQIPQSTIREDRPEMAGMNTQTLREIRRTVTTAIQDSVFPGASVAVMRDGILAMNESFGYHDYTKRREVKTTDMYDLASLTKAAATTLAAMKLVDDGRLQLDDLVADYKPSFQQEPKNRITIHHLLTHTSGLPAFKPYVDEITDAELLMEAILNEPLENEPGAEDVYSDLGFIILADIIEDITGETLHRYLTREFYYPLGMQWTMFNPLSRSSTYIDRTPPTEIDTIYRNKTVRGEVHDERAYYLRGIAGHAGLFSTARNLSILSQMLLNGGFYGGRDYLSAETIQQFTALEEETPGHRALGFDLRAPDGFSTAGSKTGPRTFGHLGFTGTSLWIDPDRQISVVLLTNRTYPDRSYGSGINEIRSKISDIVMKSLEQSDELEVTQR